MDQLAALAPPAERDWLWHGYLAPGNITLLTSLWKTGKTTLITGFLAAFGRRGKFLGQAVRPGRALVVSEESHDHWAERLARQPVGPHVELLARPFLRRPTQAEWDDLTGEAAAAAGRGELNLFVVDPLARFFPGRGECDAASLLAGLDPLERVAAAGAAVLILHHPRKERSEPGSTARGSGALLGAADIILELHRFGRLKSDENRRQLIALSRRPATPQRLAYEWDPATGKFECLGDPRARQFEDNWADVLAILQGRRAAATHNELLADWPADTPKPAPSTLYDWLNRAFTLKRLRRAGRGTRLDPFRFRLANEDDEYYDRGELPPMI